MKKLAMLLTAGLALAACDGSTPPIKASGDVVIQTPQNSMPKSAAGENQPGTPPKQ